MTWSMTGFARRSLSQDGFDFTLELKSLNGKGLDVRVRVPQMIDGLDVALRKLVQSRLKRGSVALNISAESSLAGSKIALNETYIDQLADAANRIAPKFGVHTQVNIDGILALRGVIDAGSEALDDTQRDQISAALTSATEALLDDLIENRMQEGAALARLLGDQIAQIEDLTAACRARADARPEHMQARITAALERLGGLDTPISDDRIAQEVAMILVRGDITEELDRLDAHIAAARKLLAEDGPIGRQFDFLCQELNREANTLCSKAQDQMLSEHGMRLKVVIDQMREQVQNIE